MSLPSLSPVSTTTPAEDPQVTTTTTSHDTTSNISKTTTTEQHQQQQQSLILREISETINTLKSIEQVLQDLQQQADPSIHGSAAHKQEELMLELRQWERVHKS